MVFKHQILLDVRNRDAMNINLMYKIFANTNLLLPIRWDGSNFKVTLESLYKTYKNLLFNILPSKTNIYSDVNKICKILVEVIEDYLAGLPSIAFDKFNKLMDSTLYNIFTSYDKYDEYKRGMYLNLFRVVSVDDNIPYDRKRVFHTPYNLRSKISTNRYSIAGYPSLYLGTNLQLCCDELKINPYEKYSITSKFNFDFSQEYQVKILEMGIKPQDYIQMFYEENKPEIHSLCETCDILNLENSKRYNKLDKNALMNPNNMKDYIRLYPLIAACSYIRCNKKDPFAVEYVIPQMLLQWLRLKNKNINKDSKFDKVVYGIRYFSCASLLSSERGFNYVFPSNGRQGNSYYCSDLKKCFKLTNPVYINDFESIEKCEQALIKDKNLQKIS